MHSLSTESNQAVCRPAGKHLLTQIYKNYRHRSTAHPPSPREQTNASWQQSLFNRHSNTCSHACYLPMQTTHGDITGIVRHHQVIGSRIQSSYTSGYILGTETCAVYTVDMHRMRGIVQRAECNVTWNKPE